MAKIIAIDGQSGVGKTTTSRLVAHELGLPHIDTGAMYRALALAAMREEIDTRDETKLEELASRVRIDFIPGERARVLLNGDDVTSLIRTPEMSMAASNVSAHSSATGRSVVPAVTMQTEPLGPAGAGPSRTVRDVAFAIASGKRSESAARAAASVRVTRKRPPRSAIRSATATHCAGVFPSP